MENSDQNSALERTLKRIRVGHETGMLGPRELLFILVLFGNEFPDFIPQLVPKIPKNLIPSFCSYLVFYPFSDTGWSTLPKDRPTDLHLKYPEGEWFDLRDRQYGEDRVSVELFRKELKKLKAQSVN